ncbi:hypothetical protein OL233_01060 [Vagococcus sp. PNs007]|uniref:TonB-dependent receptor n=1 Tax=Vagococcus proximus TaxID=2991417 RepID=A0ABT5WYN1_9ENTE|nr:hypothetical protein [Vagococcus proximus]MDF0478863.1 hypothetical protein [Vagococcus proximus]
MKLKRLSTAALFSLLLFQQANAAEDNASEKTIYVKRHTKEQETATAPQDSTKEVTPPVNIGNKAPDNVKTKAKVVSFYKKEDRNTNTKSEKYNEDYFNDSISLAKTPMVLNGSNPSGGLPPEAVQETSYLGNWMGTMSESINR